MKFNKIIALPALALTMWGLGACTDEVKYDPAEELTTPQVYFPTTTPSSIDIEENQTSVTINVERVNTTGAITVPVTATATVGGEATDIFTVSTVAAFADGSNTAPISIDFDFAKIKQETKYTISLNLEGADLTPYGKSSQTVTLQYAPWSSWTAVKGTGVYTLNCAYGGSLGLSIETRKSLLNPENVQYRFKASELITSWVIVNLNTTTNIIRMPFQANGGKNGDAAWQMCDTYTAFTEVFNPASLQEPLDPEDYKDASWFDPKTGVMHISTCWYAKGKGLWGPGNEMIQLPGYPDYSVSISNNGTFISEGDSQEFAIIDIAKGDDVASYAVGFYQGELSAEKVKEKADAMKANVDQVLYPSSRSFQFPIAEEDYYTVVVVPYDSESNPQETVSYSFFYEVQGIDWNEGWTTLTTKVNDKVVPLQALFTDAFTVNIGLSKPAQFLVTVQKSDNREGLYRIDNPFKDDPYGVGVDRGHYYIYINAADPDNVTVPVSYVGFFNVGSTKPGQLVDGTKFNFPANSMGVLAGINAEGQYVWRALWDKPVTLLDLDPKEDEEEDAETTSVKVPYSVQATAKAKITIMSGIAPVVAKRKFTPLL